MSGRELSRKVRDDGMTEIMVALGVDRQGTLIVYPGAVNDIGFQDMLDLHAAKHAGLVDIRDRGMPQ
ncbi:MAG TPA: hypothetical protein VFU23_09390 [Gemmatimonadales bacterium]|nr:hypothetical protein [Gemmatimonadales bacterium]